MKKLLLFLAISISCHAQLGNAVMKFFTSDPTGVKCSSKQMATLVSDGSLYNCDPTTHAFVGVGGGGISGLTTGYIPKAASASSLANSACDEGITSANILTCADSGGMVIASDGTHAGALGLIGNTTVPSLTSNNFHWIGPNSASFTAWGIQMGATEPAAAGFLVTGAASSHVAQGSIVSTAPATLTDGATVTWAIGSNPVATATLLFTAHGGSRTLNITGPVSGATYVLKVTQDGTGSEGLTLGTGCTWKVISGGSGAVTLSTAAGAVDVLTFWYDGTNCNANLGKNYN